MVIATRQLVLHLATGDLPIPVHLHAPTEGDRCWECRFEIAWPEGTRAAVVRGLDGVQALYLAMQRVAAELYGSRHHASGALTWGKFGDGYGFPMAKPGYPDLVGEDRISQVP